MTLRFPWYFAPYAVSNFLLSLLQDCKDVCAVPLAVECRVVGSHIPFDQAGENLQAACTTDKGLICKNEDQSDKRCEDYEIRFQCPPGKLWIEMIDKTSTKLPVSVDCHLFSEV